MVKVLGYYVDREEQPTPSTVFVAFQLDGHYGHYCPVGQHGDLKDISYLNECRKISKEEYLEVSKGYYTPLDYLKENNGKKFIFTIEVLNAEYLEGLDESGNVLPEDEEEYGNLDEVTALIDFQYLNSQEELDEHIEYLSKKYRVEKDRINYQYVVEDFKWDETEHTVGTVMLSEVLEDINDYSALDLSDEEMKILESKVADLKEYDDVEREINRYIQEIGYIFNEECVWVRKSGNDI